MPSSIILKRSREGYESALPVFITKAAEDDMAALAALANRISPARKGALAITRRDIDRRHRSGCRSLMRSSSSKATASPLSGRALRSRFRKARPSSMRKAKFCCRVCGICTRTSNRSSGGRFISRQA